MQISEFTGCIKENCIKIREPKVFVVKGPRESWSKEARAIRLA